MRLPELQRVLVEAARREELQAANAWPRRAWPAAASGPLQLPRLRTIVINLALCLVGTTIGLSATGVFNRGANVAPEAQPAPNAREGIAIAGSTKLLALRVPDPAGGPAWGMRVTRTTRGLTCVAVGRVDYGTIGVLGRDGAFADDGRFHPLSPNLFAPLGCAVTDAHGDGYLNVALGDMPASGLLRESPSAGGCTPGEPSGGHRAELPVCAPSDLRELYFGLLGPDAVSVTYRLPGGGLRTVHTLAPDGAYLIVMPQPSDSGFTDEHGGPGIGAGAIVAVTYRRGRTCEVPRESLTEACPPVGFVSSPTPRVTAAQLATPVRVRITSARAAQSLLVRISFTSRVAITSSRSYYEIALRFTRSRTCADSGAGVSTSRDVHAGELRWSLANYTFRCGYSSVTSPR